MKAIVTVRFPRNPKHNPINKRTGKCPLFSHDITQLCTDITGEHHSYIQKGESLEDIRKRAEEKFNHITRIEIILEE